jgi:hypothetical protein
LRARPPPLAAHLLQAAGILLPALSGHILAALSAVLFGGTCLGIASCAG